MIRQNEGDTTLTVSTKDIEIMNYYHGNMFRRLQGTLQDNSFLNNLSMSSSLASFFIKSPKLALGVGIGSFATGFLASLLPSEKSSLARVVDYGQEALSILALCCRYKLDRYDNFEIEFSYVDYNSNSVTASFVQSEIYITRAHVRGQNGWVSMNIGTKEMAKRWIPEISGKL